MAPRPSLILASSSPRRASYLRELGFAFRRVSPDVDETRRRGESPRSYVRRLALEKTRKVAARFPGAWVVGADTTVVVNGTLLGKPAHADDARRMLRRLSGQSHTVLSGIALAREELGVYRSAVATTRVFFRSLRADDIGWYVATGEPMDKAGAYGIQGKGGLLVERIEGSFSNVVGFPVETFFEIWRAAGQPLPG
jgi:nucleoside triphosphate pyrophosphatase